MRQETGTSRSNPGISTLPVLRPPQRRRQAAVFPARKKEQDAVSAPARADIHELNPPATPVGPRQDPDCVVFTGSENALRIMPPIGGQMPPRKPCQHVAAFRTRFHPPSRREEIPRPRRSGLRSVAPAAMKIAMRKLPSVAFSRLPLDAPYVGSETGNSPLRTDPKTANGDDPNCFPLDYFLPR